MRAFSWPCLHCSWLPPPSYLWHQTKRVAEGADRQLKFLEESSRRTDRPYLYIKIRDTASLRNPDEDVVPSLRLSIVNYGRTPAILRAYAISLLVEPPLPLRSPLAIINDRYDAIAPSDEFVVPEPLDVMDVEPGRNFNGQIFTSLVLYGYLQYEDQAGALHMDNFCMRGNRDSKSFRLEGGSEHNKRETTYPGND